jgi:hypothetical protein
MLNAPTSYFLAETLKYLYLLFSDEDLVSLDIWVLVAGHLIPSDSRVEIDAKIAAGYFTSSKQITEADLFKTVGTTWEETEHCSVIAHDNRELSKALRTRLLPNHPGTISARFSRSLVLRASDLEKRKRPSIQHPSNKHHEPIMNEAVLVSSS